MKAILGKLSVIVLAGGLAGSAIVTGCSSNTDDKSQSAKDQGAVDFKLDIGGGATINTMHVIVFGNSLGAVGASTNLVRDLDVGALSGANTAFTLTLTVGSNYQVKLSSPDNATCTGTGAFGVIAGQSSSSTVSVTMSCAATDVTGGETVNANACTPPVVNSVFISPNSQIVGHKVQLNADAESGSTVQWAQSGAGAGTFGSSSAPTTDFTCTSAGAIVIQLGLTKNGCSTSKTYSVSCTDTSGGGIGCQPILSPTGLDTGFDTCEDGTKQRRAAIQCPAAATDPAQECGTVPEACVSDADCKQEPYGICANAHKLEGYCGCFPGCRSDADCGAGSICECGSPLGRCTPAKCATNADCGEGFGCTASAGSIDLAGGKCDLFTDTTYACQSGADRCRVDKDCPDGGCVLEVDHRVCVPLCPV